MRFRVMRTWAVGFSFGAASLCAGCTLPAATHSNGLPKISRYTNPLQLEWALSRYSTLAEAGQQTSTALVQEACQGWRKMTFDLASARQYPKMLRLSPEASGLLAAIDELPAAMSRHPLPAACQASPIPPAVVAVASAPPPVAAPVTWPEAPTPTPAAPVASAPASSPAAPDAVQAPSTAAVAPQSQPPVVVQATPQPQPPTVMTEPLTKPVPPLPAAQPTLRDEVQEEWERLILASGVAATSAEVAANRQARADLKELSTLAQSSQPAIRLRARFHLLGQCASAIAATERLGQSDAAAAYCVGRLGNEELKATQTRLVKSMLSAWRGGGPEPFSDWVVALASFASRDNPVLDGPRIAR